jgi:hypothetical protein
MGDCIANFVPEQNSYGVPAMEAPIAIFLPRAAKNLNLNPKA